ncbi:hypothetical protein E2562_030760, partial [Oryza meyeriana var. granulata]
WRAKRVAWMRRAAKRVVATRNDAAEQRGALNCQSLWNWERRSRRRHRTN